jgi:predicted transcriptional regulator
MTTVKNRLIEYLCDPYEAETPGRAVSEIAEILEISRSTAQFELRKLRANGIVEVETFGNKKAFDKITLKEQNG